MRFTQRRGLQNFLRGACGIIARKVMGAERGRAVRPALAVKEAQATVENLSQKLCKQLSEEARMAGKHAAAARIASVGITSKTPELRFTSDAGRFWSQRPFTRIVSWGKDFDSVLSYLRLNTLEALGFLSRSFTRALPTPMIRSRVLTEISQALGYG